MPTPRVPFSEERLPNGLRLVMAEDHLAPVVAVNIWYDVGSKHETPGKTGFAHLFEHVMFQGSRNVGEGRAHRPRAGRRRDDERHDLARPHQLLRDAAAHQLELALWLEADRMGTLLDALSQENLDNQREVVKNEKRWSYDNRPYGSWNEKLQAHLFPPEHPYHHPTIGSMEDLDAASVEDVSGFFRTWYAPNNAVAGDRRRLRSGRGARLGGAVLRRHPGQPGDPEARRPVAAADARRGASARPCPTACRCRASTSGSGRRRSAIRASTRWSWPARSSPAARAAGSTGAWSATSGSRRTSSPSASGSSAAPRSPRAGRRSGRASTVATRRGGVPGGAGPARDGSP